MDIGSLDLNLLVAFNAIYQERNITLAADRIGLSQPATSNALARLRKLFDDRLFVRTARGMEPTPFAEQLAVPVSRACELINEALNSGPTFVPATSRRKFTFYMTDIGEAVMLPGLLKNMETAAPNISIRIERPPKYGSQDAMAAGEVDLAVGFFPALRGGFFVQRLYKDDFVCLVRADNTLIKPSNWKEKFSELPHVVVASTGTGHGSAVEKIIAGQRLDRRVALTVPNFLVLPTIVSQTNSIAVIPRKLAEPSLRNMNLKVLNPPCKIPSMEIKQHWHERYHHDPANRWMRGVIAALFLNKSDTKDALEHMYA